MSSRDGHAGTANTIKMSEMNLNPHIGRADLREVDTEAAVKNGGVQSIEESQAPRVLIGGSCEDRVRLMCTSHRT